MRQKTGTYEMHELPRAPRMSLKRQGTARAGGSKIAKREAPTDFCRLGATPTDL